MILPVDDSFTRNVQYIFTFRLTILKYIGKEFVTIFVSENVLKIDVFSGIVSHRMNEESSHLFSHKQMNKKDRYLGRKL